MNGPSQGIRLLQRATTFALIGRACSKSYTGTLTREIEERLVQRYHETGCEHFATLLVEPYRPMAIGIAKKRRPGNGTKLHARTEYGMFGLRIAAQPSRPSKTKKGKLVGYDPSTGYRFGTYARAYAEKEIQRALWDFDLPSNLADTQAEFKAWAASPIPEEVLEAVKDRPDDDHESDNELVFDYDHIGQSRQKKRRSLSSPNDPGSPCFCISATNLGWLVYWLKYEKPKPAAIRRKTRTTDRELANKARYYAGYQDKLRSFEDIAADGLDAWDDNEDPHSWSEGGCVDAEDVWHPTSGAFRKEQYSLPDKVLKQRWRLASKSVGFKRQLGAILTISAGDLLP